MTYGDLEDELLVVVGGLEGVQNRGELGTVEFDWESSQQRPVCNAQELWSSSGEEVLLTVNDGTDDLLRYFVSLDPAATHLGERAGSGRVAEG